MSVPQSNVCICSGVMINSRYEHSIYFHSGDAQASYFAGKVVKTYQAYTFLRKSWPLKVEATMEEAASWTYLYFKNGNTGKTYYYFINNIEYINDHTVELALELDVLQTYAFDVEMRPCFIERTHVSDDTIGANTQDEELDTGELNSALITTTANITELCIMVLSTITLNGVSKETTVNAYGSVYNGVFSGLTLSVVEMKDWPTFSRQLDNLSEWGKMDGIVAMWMYPKALVGLGGENSWGDDVLAKTVTGANTAFVQVEIPGATDFDGYQPRNKKLYCYPYNFMYVTNNAGTSATYHFERFDIPETLATFMIQGALAPDAGALLTTADYKPGTTADGLMMPAYPTCSWDSDTYKIWLAQNQNAHNLVNNQAMIKQVGGVATVAGGLLMGNLGAAAGGVGMFYSGASDIANLLATKADRAIEPPQAKGTFSASVNLASNLHQYSFYRKFCTAEYARRIDDYFTMYGYKVNRIDTPSRRRRRAFTYVKTIGAKVKGNLCTEDATKIESIYNNGITWWVNGDVIGNYTQNNDPV